MHICSGFTYYKPYTLSRGRPEPRPHILLCHPIVITMYTWYRNINLLCIDYANCLALAPD